MCENQVEKKRRFKEKRILIKREKVLGFRCGSARRRKKEKDSKWWGFEEAIRSERRIKI